jgi:hypothetical protein
MPRNPKWFPATGDLLCKGTTKGTLLERSVLSVLGDRVTFVSKGKQHSTTLEAWRYWAVDSKIKLNE